MELHGLRKLLLLIGLLSMGIYSFSQTVFINEIHYDNSGGDVFEGIEIAAPAGTDLSCYDIILVNGSGGVTYATVSLSGIVSDQECGMGTIWFEFTDGGGAGTSLQNGSPDGIALYNTCTNTLEQFISYEGSFTATDPPIAGETSTDIGVSEGGGANGQSLQLGGIGTTATDFTWENEQSSTYGAVNANQSFCTSVTPTQLTITDEPLGCSTTGGTFSVTVCATDASENVDGSYTDNITISIASQPGGATLSGTLTQAATSGCATFSDLSVDVDGDYTFNVTDGTLTDDVSSSITFAASCDNCIEIESILVDACNANSGTEGENEMVHFSTNTSINTADISTTWPNNPDLGICQDGTTAGIVSSINSTITGGGTVYEPPGGIIPAGAEVIYVTSTDFDYLNHDWSNLNYDVYMIFQCAGNTAGHFANCCTPGTRELIIDAGICADTVAYERSDLTGNNDGAAVEFTPDGTPSYGNNGCSPPLFPLPISAINLSLAEDEMNSEVLLQWTLKMNIESDDAYFQILKSKDKAENFEVIGEMSVEDFYNHNTFSDLNREGEVSYYQVKLIEKGKYYFSNIVKNKPYSNLMLTPNPVNQDLMVHFNLENKSECTIKIYNVLGVEVLTQQFEAAKGQNVKAIDFSDFDIGSYYLLISNSELNTVQKIVVKH